MEIQIIVMKVLVIIEMIIMKEIEEAMKEIILSIVIIFRTIYLRYYKELLILDNY